jgi:hypothetical protein
MKQSMPIGNMESKSLTIPGFAVVQVPENIYTPTLPIKIRRKKATEGLIFPWGRFIGIW